MTDEASQEVLDAVDEYSEDNIKEKLAEVLHSKNGKEPSQDEIESLYQSLKKIAKKLQNNE